jgi:hypothetical protein
LEKPSGAHDAFASPLRTFVDVFVCKVYHPGFLGEHANLLVGGLVFDEIALFVLLLPFLSVSMLVVFKVWAFPSSLSCCCRLGFGALIAKVGGSSMWKELKRTFEIRAEKSMSESLTSFWEVAFLQSFS